MCDVCQGTAVSCLLLILHKCPRPDPVLPSTKRIYVALSTCTTAPAEERSLFRAKLLEHVAFCNSHFPSFTAQNGFWSRFDSNECKFPEQHQTTVGQFVSQTRIFSSFFFYPVFLFLDIHPTHGRLHANI